MPKTILIIDDAIPLHKLVTVYLKPDNLDVQSAYDGESGLIAAAASQPSLILLDVEMPGMDGYEVCRRLKANPATASIPVIFLTASSTLDNRIHGLDVGAADYISKPFKPSDLRTRVRASLRSRSQIEATSLVDGPTGLWNRTYLNAHLEYHLSLSDRLGMPLSCIMAGIDDGEALAEKFGQPFATDMIRTVGRVFTGACRTEDVACRFDTWEFAILVTGANGAAASLVANRLRREIERQMSLRNDGAKQVTCSFGVCDARQSDSGTFIERAVAALAGARRAGTNTVYISDESCGIPIAA